MTSFNCSIICAFAINNHNTIVTILSRRNNNKIPFSAKHTTSPMKICHGKCSNKVANHRT